MKQLLTALLAVFAIIASAQDSLNIEERMDIIKDITDVHKNLTDAQKDYADAVKDYNKAKEELIEKENNMEKARMAKKASERALKMEKQRLNPIVVSRYVVNINPILEEMSQGSQYGYSMYLVGSESSSIFNLLSKNTDSEFKKFMKAYDAAKVKKKKGELLFDDIFIPEISSTRMDIYTDFDNEDNGVVMKTYFNLGGRFLDTNAQSDAATEAEKLMDKFARHMRTIEVEAELKDQEKELERLQKDLEKSRKEIIDAREDIGKNEIKIAENRLKIDENENLIEQQIDAIEITRKKLAKID